MAVVVIIKMMPSMIQGLICIYSAEVTMADAMCIIIAVVELKAVGERMQVPVMGERTQVAAMAAGKGEDDEPLYKLFRLFNNRILGR